MISPDTAVRLLSLVGLVEEAPLSVGESEKFTILGMFASVTKEEKETILATMRKALVEMTAKVDEFEGA